jgi:hypothetical protein
LIVSGFLLVAYSIVSSATSGSGMACGTGSGASPCITSVAEYVFLIPGLILLAIGAVSVAVVIIEIR